MGFLIYIYLYMYIYIFSFIYTYIHIHIHIYMYIYTPWKPTTLHFLGITTHIVGVLKTYVFFMGTWGFRWYFFILVDNKPWKKKTRGFQAAWQPVGNATSSLGRFTWNIGGEVALRKVWWVVGWDRPKELFEPITHIQTTPKRQVLVRFFTTSQHCFLL